MNKCRIIEQIVNKSILPNKFKEFFLEICRKVVEHLDPFIQIPDHPDLDKHPESNFNLKAKKIIVQISFGDLPFLL
jgi:hypothetical protein